MTDNWRVDAACASVDPELFYPTSYISPDGAFQAEYAKQICATCPALAACRTYILNSEGGRGLDSRSGIYAGLTPKERYAAHRRSIRHHETPAAA
jgi:WhiB family redox-sensing transcriptional regulator